MVLQALLHLASPAVCLCGFVGAEQREGVEKGRFVLVVGKGMG